MILTYRYRLKCHHSSKRLREQAIACNQVWNWCVAQQRDVEARYRAGAKSRKWSTHFDLARACRGVGIMLGIHQQTVQAICQQFAQSRDQSHRAPRFRASFGSKRALGWVPFQRQSRRIDGNSVIYLGKRIRWFGNRTRPLPTAAGGGAFVEDALGRWWVCFRVEVADRSTHAGPSVGIDLGLKSLVALSNGRSVATPQHYRKIQAKLAVAQRAGNKDRARRIHARIANARKDFLHKLSTSLTREHSLIAVGNVSPSKLAKTRFAKSVLDAAWSTFRAQLRYKCQQAGVAYVEVDEKFTTQTCSGCESIAGPKGRAGLNKREWDCPECGASHNRDVNSAKVILSRALGVQRPDEESRVAA